jgi:hypothetical protein
VPNVIDELKRNHALGQRCRCRVVPYLNDIVEQDHRAIKRRISASLAFRSFAGAERIYFMLWRAYLQQSLLFLASIPSIQFGPDSREPDPFVAQFASGIDSESTVDMLRNCKWRLSGQC